jgi:sterol 3beta-glucosyltransferase
MKVAVLSFGTRGDVQPLVAYAVGLRAAGHDAYLCAPRNFSTLAGQYGVPFRPMSFDTAKLIQRPDVQRLLESGGLLRFLMLKHARLMMRVQCLDAWNLSEDAEAMVFRLGAPPAAYSIARKRKLPGIEVGFWPLEPSREIPPLGGKGAPRRGPWYNRLVSGLTYTLFWRFFLPPANFFRREFLDMPSLPFLGPLEEYRRVGQPSLYAFSPTLIPRPSDWRSDAHVIGYLFLDEPPGWQPPPNLCRFLEGGPKPVYIGFGSMSGVRSRDVAAAVMEAMGRSGQRVVWQGHPPELGKELPENIFVAGDVPHSWLFPRMAAIVHHAGAGTTGSALRAGVPSVAVPHAVDQPYWARRAWEMGVCPPPMPLRQLTPQRLKEALDAVTSDRAMQDRAAEIGRKVAAEDGLGRAVELFEHYVRRFRSGPQP